MRLVFSELASLEVDEMWMDVLEASKDVETADRYRREFLEKLHEKVRYPKSGAPIYNKGIFTGYYFIVYKEYMAFYQVAGDEMRVIRVMMRKKDYLNRLFGHRW